MKFFIFRSDFNSGVINHEDFWDRLSESAIQIILVFVDFEKIERMQFPDRLVEH